MCFYIPSDQVKAKVARKDIRCKKVMKFEKGEPYISIHFRKVWRRGKKEVKRTFRPYSSTYFMGRGHGEGFHSFRIRAGASMWASNQRVIECIIPKGALYFSNRKQYFSNQLIVKGLLKSK